MNSGSNTNNNEKGVEVRTHDIPVADAMTEFMKEGWDLSTSTCAIRTSPAFKPTGGVKDSTSIAFLPIPKVWEDVQSCLLRMKSLQFVLFEMLGQ
jgi:hypothetical protein